MKRNPVKVTILVIILMLFYSSGLAEQSKNEKTVFSFEGKRFVAEIPAKYLIYTSEMAENSPLLKLTGASANDMDSYMDSLQCVLCGVHEEKYHQIWISVKNRNDAFPNSSNGISPEEKRAYYDGVALSRGNYTEYERNGQYYYIFEDNPSIAEGGRSYYISFFINKDEVSVRWESGNGKLTFGDMGDIQTIAYSIKTEEQDSEEQKAAADRKAGLVVTESSLFYNEREKSGYFFAKVENHGQSSVSFGHTRFAAFDTKGQLLYENNYIDSSPMYALIEPGDYIYVSRDWRADNVTSDQNLHFEFQPEPYDYSIDYRRISCEASFKLIYEYGSPHINLEVLLENTTNELICSPQVVYAFYNKDGQLITVGNQYLNEVSIFPNSRILITPWVNTDLIKYLVDKGQTPETVVALIYYEP